MIFYEKGVGEVKQADWSLMHNVWVEAGNTFSVIVELTEKAKANIVQYFSGYKDAGVKVTKAFTPGVSFTAEEVLDEGTPIQISGVFTGAGTAATLLTRLFTALAAMGFSYTAVSFVSQSEEKQESIGSGVKEIGAAIASPIKWFLLLLAAGAAYNEYRKGG